MVFKNSKFFTRQSLELLAGGVRINRKTLFESIEYEISYEHISNKKKIQSTINNNSLFIAVCLIILGTLFLLGSLAEISPLLILIGLVFLVTTFILRKKTITIACFDGNVIELYFTNRNKPEITAFANQIIDSSNSFLLNKYSKLDRDLPIDNQLSNLDFLLNREIITEEEFENLKNQLLGRNTKSKIGFTG